MGFFDTIKRFFIWLCCCCCSWSETPDKMIIYNEELVKDLLKPRARLPVRSINELGTDIPQNIREIIFFYYAVGRIEGNLQGGIDLINNLDLSNNSRARPITLVILRRISYELEIPKVSGYEPHIINVRLNRNNQLVFDTIEDEREANRFLNYDNNFSDEFERN